jgi:hypothetical protein
MLGDLTTWRTWQAWRRCVIEKYDAQRGRCPLSALTAQLGTANPGSRQIVSDLYDQWHRLLADGVRALKKSGGADAGVRPDQAATAILAAIQGGVVMLQATDRIDYLEVALAEALDGLRRPRARVRG